MRVSDAEREATAQRLRDAGTTGRLDTDELEGRLGDAYRARTRGELERLTIDLPPAPAAAGAVTPMRRSPNARARLATFIVTNVTCIAIWAASGADGSFWPIWVLLGTGIGLLGTLVRSLLGVEDDDHHLRGPRPPRPPRLPG